MTRRRPWSEIRRRLSPEAQERAAKKTTRALEELSLLEIRKARQLTQEQVALSLRIRQSAVSKIERQADLYLSTLRRFIEAMGGQLRVVAEFPDRAIEIAGLSEDPVPRRRRRSRPP